MCLTESSAFIYRQGALEFYGEFNSKTVKNFARGEQKIYLAKLN